MQITTTHKRAIDQYYKELEFFTYTEPDIATFEAAVKEFKERVPELAQALLTIIEREYKQNKKFIEAFNAFTELCRTSLDPKIVTTQVGLAGLLK